jgi:hypothetical protein
MHLLNEGLYSHGLRAMIAQTEPFMPHLRSIIESPVMTVRTPYTTWTANRRADGHVGFFSVAVDNQQTVAELVVVGSGGRHDIWRESVQRCRDLHRAGLVPLTHVEEAPPDTDAWIAVILYHSHSRLSAESTMEMDLLAVGLARAFIEQAHLASLCLPAQWPGNN